MLKDLKVSVWVDTLTGCLSCLSKEPIPIFWRHGPLRLRISSLCCARGLSSVGVFLWTCRCTRQWEMIKDGQMWFKDRRFLSTIKEFRYIEVQRRTGLACKWRLMSDHLVFKVMKSECCQSTSPVLCLQEFPCCFTTFQRLLVVKEYTLKRCNSLQERKWNRRWRLDAIWQVRPSLWRVPLRATSLQRLDFWQNCANMKQNSMHSSSMLIQRSLHING